MQVGRGGPWSALNGSYVLSVIGQTTVCPYGCRHLFRHQLPRPRIRVLQVRRGAAVEAQRLLEVEHDLLAAGDLQHGELDGRDGDVMRGLRKVAALGHDAL